MSTEPKNIADTSIEPSTDSDAVQAVDDPASVPDDPTPDDIASDGDAELAEAADTAEGPDEVDSGEVAESQTGDDDESSAKQASEGGPDPAEEDEDPDEIKMNWYILKVQVNREESIRDALQRRVKIEGLDAFFGDIVVPTEDVAEFTKSGKRRVVKKKLYPGYIMVHMAINDDTWFLVRETPGIGDFTGSAGKPTPMETSEVERILNLGGGDDESESPVKTAIPYAPGDRVRVKEGHFLNFEGEVESVDEANGRVTVMINIFGRSTPVELEHWQIESV